MIFLGIDPGTRRVGYGVIRREGGTSALVTAGLLEVKGKEDAEVLLEISTGVRALIQQFRPQMIAVEKLYFSKNQKTALRVAEGRGVILATAREEGVTIREFSPNELKLAITGYGHATKAAVLKMVRLTLREPKLDLIDDASDALALAILAAETGKPNYTQYKG